jgi:bacterioferritin-associated ferredoxin
LQKQFFLLSFICANKKLPQRGAFAAAHFKHHYIAFDTFCPSFYFSFPPPKTMYVCLCNAVTEREVRHAVALGASSLADLKESLGVAMCCGKCADCARGVLTDERKAQRAAAATIKLVPHSMVLRPVS